ncbi:dienelactone hydrolase endo-1,3,1,4-beta-D-glucanase [Coprinopsis marcescibilis]|uniref:Dienelactone hydrolase endo-1,3,1,4-beta-D-glucanase n=1 Tax=Coprinopsis marcescibilis TaxID=230819 RepID=A0A5C3LA29_COPMA|nr:dienelactone hydrolase endo-1,3,1,4-beta-D-glucanase [Coprinopsis marcescibilis]
MSLCADCVKGVRHEGTPEGSWEEIGGVTSYVATPLGDYPKDRVILYIADIFGPQLINAQLLADDFARNGFKTIIPDYLNGDFVAADALDPGSQFDLGAWFAKHGASETRPPLDRVTAGLKEQGVTSFGATGYCFGGRYVFDLGFDNVISAAVVNHPSLLKSPEDLQKYFDTSKTPLLINSCTIDTQFPHEAQAQADEILGNGKFTAGYKREYFECCTHGFAVRGDLSDPKVKAGKEGAFAAAVKWFKAKL